MAGYTKLFHSILASTIWRADDKTRLVWITLLAMADRYGLAEGSIPGLADFAHVSIPDCERALAELAGPDKYSRSKEHNGCRIRPVDGGWQILNHGKYREKMNLDERREYLRVKQAESRARKRQQQSTNVNECGDTYTPSTHAYSYSDQISNTINEVIPKTETNTTSNGNGSLSPAALPPSDQKRDTFTNRQVTERAGRFIERYQELYPQHLKGARYAARPVRDYAAAVTLCETWADDAYLDKLAVVFLTTDHKFAQEGSRTIPQFLGIASWCDTRLRQWAHENGVTM